MGMVWETQLGGYFHQRREMCQVVKYVKALHKGRDRKKSPLRLGNPKTMGLKIQP